MSLLPKLDYVRYSQSRAENDVIKSRKDLINCHFRDIVSAINSIRRDSWSKSPNLQRGAHL